ncbi:MAG TPA: pyridoxal 5'-phosphate synthase glutaminase subunit PdxT [Dehalococcoidia bacterium]|nr:pyridoxal 5'-phosphate synthase glutaminase subunit PdxT [Dehalococcoidia bacterium]
MKIGVLALQGAFIEHISVIQQIGVEAAPVRLPSELGSLDWLIIPGGESTTILNLMQTFNLIKPLKELSQAGLPILGTCAGMVCLAKKVSNSNNSNMETLAVMDMEVRRNAFGRQADSFETELPVPALGHEPFAAIFIRAPVIERVGPQVEILAKLPNDIAVAAKQGELVVSAFHPELSHDLRFHRYFLKIAASH